MFPRPFFSSALASVALATTACGSGGQIEALPPPARVQPYLSANDGLKQCLGAAIDRGYPAPLLEVFVPEIVDRTTQPFNIALTAGGTDFANAVLLSMGQKVKIPAASGGSIRPVGDPSQIILISGAWSGYDRVAKSGAGAIKVRFGGMEVRLAADKSYDLVSGDFVWRRAGSPHIQGGVSLVVAVQTRSGEGDVFLQDSKNNGGAATFRLQSVQGIHQSQRALVEFATISMMAQATGVRLADCADQAYPGLLQRSNQDFLKMSKPDRSRSVQTLLRELGYYRGNVDGIWGRGSSTALTRFLLAQGFPPAAEPTAEHYVSLMMVKRRIESGS